ncbi:MAG: precorrin-8X methylmutase [Candidatus Omnitrophica bacterium]|nr:precorrin-8X methylmutase [Candidatus Omnitrophota bacterium]
MQIFNPEEIEKRSFEIIEEYVKDGGWIEQEKAIVKRIIHATVEPLYAKEIIFHPYAVKSGLRAIKSGKNIIVDSSMVKAGINKKLLSGFGGKVLCFIEHNDVEKEAKKSGVTKAIISMRKAVKIMNGNIVAIGNAPTALMEICRLVNEGKTKPALVIGLPVGFVGAKDAKGKLLSINIPYITNNSQKGGSSATAATINALLNLALNKNGKRICKPEK